MVLQPEGEPADNLGIFVQGNLAALLTVATRLRTGDAGRASARLASLTAKTQRGHQKAVRKATINIVKDLPMDAGELLRTRNGGTAREGQWQRTGVRFEQQTVGNAICIMARRPGVVGHSICSIPRAKEFVEVDVTAPVQELPSLDTVGALVQKAATRR
jgi:hypothetical protein